MRRMIRAIKRLPALMARDRAYCTVYAKGEKSRPDYEKNE
jgi:hypothetical protein